MILYSIRNSSVSRIVVKCPTKVDYKSIILMLFFIWWSVDIMHAKAEEDSIIALPVISIETVGHKMPTCIAVNAPEGCWGRGTANNDYVPGHMIITQSDSVLYDSGEYTESDGGERTSGMRIRIRGNTSAHRAFPPYRIKLSCKGDPLNFGYEAKSWVLIRPMEKWGRNYYLLDSHVGREVALVAGMEWQPEYKFVELYLNGDYRGIYLLTEAVERGDDRLDISKTGFIAEADAYWWMEDPSYVIHTPQQVKQLAYTFKYPKAEDFDADLERLLAIDAFLNQIEEKVYGQAEDLDEWISIKSFAAWHWAHDVLGTYEAAGSNIYFHKKNMLPDSLQKSKLKMGPVWDFDSSFSIPINSWCEHHSRNYAYGRELYKREDFLLRYKYLCDERLDLVRKQVSDVIDSLQVTFGINLDLAIERHNKRCGETMPQFSQQADFIRTWMKNRTQWMADNLHYLTDNVLSGVANHQADHSNHECIRIYTVQGILIGTRSLNDDLSLPRGTYILKHGNQAVKYCF